MSTEKKEIIHKGEWCKEQIHKAGFSYRLIADLIGMNKSTIFRMLQKQDLDFRSMKLITDALNIDLRVQWPEVDSLYNETILNYKILYEKEAQKVLQLQEELARYGNEPGQKRDNDLGK